MRRERMTKRLSVPVTPSMQDRIDRQCRDRRVTQVVREALERYLTDKEQSNASPNVLDA